VVWLRHETLDAHEAAETEGDRMSEKIHTGTEELLGVLDGHVATLTLNRPEKRNALSDHLTPALRQMLLELDTDPRVRCLVITGAGEAFCAGGDVSGMGSGRTQTAAAAEAPRPSLDDAIRTLKHKQETLSLRLQEFSKPTIAALPGPAAGAGLSIALGCDLRIAADTAFVTTAFGNSGLSGDYGCSWQLTQLVGIAKAKELFFTSRRVTAAEGLALGIFNEIVPFAELPERSAELAAQIAAGPPVAMRYMKENLNRAITADLKTCLAMEADRMVRCTQTQDHKAAVKAFLEKRPVEFTGK
jgi:enoyl-CoA hydratase/carnithine racemase